MPISDTPSSRRPGRLGRALIRMLMKRAQVVEAESVGEGFRLITLESPEFREFPWVPGQKLQIAMGSAFVARTFTPIEWDAARGRTRILGYLHGRGPGCAWLRDAGVGDECDVFGPRASIDMRLDTGMRVALGDETSIGLMYALSHQAPHRSQGVLEVNAGAITREVITRLGLDGIELYERRPADAHLDEIEHRLQEFAASGASFVLTGQASTIQRLRRALKRQGVSPSRLVTKPYWSPGKTGLD